MSDAVPQLNERDIFFKSQLASQRSVLYEGSFSQKNTKKKTSKKQIFAPECDALNLAHCCVPPAFGSLGLSHPMCVSVSH